jgi:hypothetical protein
VRLIEAKKLFSQAPRADREAVVEQLVAETLPARTRIRNGRRQIHRYRPARLRARLAPVEGEERRDCPERDPEEERDAHPEGDGSTHGPSLARRRLKREASLPRWRRVTGAASRRNPSADGLTLDLVDETHQRRAPFMP